MTITAQKVVESGKAGNGKIDWNWVKRSVVASEPPTILDIPSHLKFLQKFGGGVKQHIAFSTLSYIANSSAAHVVSGSFIEALAALKFNVDDHVVRCIHGVLMAQATGPKEKHGVGSSITEVQVKSLASGKKADCLNIHSMIEKGIDVVKSYRLDPQSSAVSKFVGDLSVNLVLHLFNVADPKFEAREDILKHFLVQITGDNTGSDAGASSAGTSKPKPTIATNLMEYDDTSGDTNAGKLKAFQLGWVTGMVVSPPKAAAKIDEQWEITYINDDGSVGLASLLENGKVSTTTKVVKLADLKSWHKEHHRKKLLDYDPAKDDLLNHSEVVEIVNKSIVMMGLHQLQCTNTDITWKMQELPVRRLFCLDEANKGSICLVPFTTSISLPLPSGNDTSNGNKVEVKLRGTTMFLQKRLSTRRSSYLCSGFFVYATTRQNVTWE